MSCVSSMPCSKFMEAEQQQLNFTDAFFASDDEEEVAEAEQGMKQLQKAKQIASTKVEPDDSALFAQSNDVEYPEDLNFDFLDNSTEFTSQPPPPPQIKLEPQYAQSILIPKDEHLFPQSMEPIMLSTIQHATGMLQNEMRTPQIVNNQNLLHSFMQRTITSFSPIGGPMLNSHVNLNRQMSKPKNSLLKCKGKRCIIDNCTRRAQSNSRCKAHGGGARCQYSGCTKSSQGGGFCRAHGGGKRCQHPGCTKGQQRQGKCYVHGGIRRCNVDSCDKKDRGNGFCIAHGGGRRCITEGCTRAVRKGQYCQAHFKGEL